MLNINDFLMDFFSLKGKNDNCLQVETVDSDRHLHWHLQKQEQTSLHLLM